jgi:DNA repair protein RecO (recombination protein O)
LVDLFTASHGRMHLVARLASGSRSERSALLQPLQPLVVAWRGQGELPTLTQCEANGAPCRLAGETLISALYLNELLVRLLPLAEGQPLLWQRYRQTLEALANGLTLDWTLRLFECDLLAELGYGLDLLHDNLGREIVAEGFYRLYSENGFYPLTVAEPDIDTLRGSTLQALASGEMPDEQARREARQLLRQRLALLLGDRPLRSRELFRRPAPPTLSDKAAESPYE